MSAFVLVHGAGHGGWCWYKVIAGLEAAGHEVLAPDLPSLGADPSPLASCTLAACAERVGELLRGASEPVVLVGHSMGGPVISEVAERHPDRIATLVYLTAQLLPHGQSLVSNAERFPEDAVDMSGIPLQTDEQTGVTSLVLTDIPGWQDFFYALCGDEDRALAQCCLKPQNMDPFTTPVSVSEANFGRVPRVFIQCLQDRAIPLGLQQRMCEETPCRQVLQLDADHSPFFCRPRELTQMLLDVAADIS